MNYRYTLRRNWLGAGGIVNFVMLNPSTADDVYDDPTIRKCMGFAKLWGYSGLVVTNLFAYRATDPRELKRLAPDLAIGNQNDFVLFDEARRAAAVVCAWGEHGSWLGRNKAVMGIGGPLDDLTLARIGSTRGGHPLHPSRCAYTSAPEVFRLAAEAA